MRYSITDYSRTAAGKGWGPGWPTNRAADMARVQTARTGTAVNVHRRIARLVKMLLDETERRGYLLRQRDTGGFNSRPISGTSRPSNHSWGLAVDLNWQVNYASYDGRAHGDIPSWLPRLWNDYGFAWGGNYNGSFVDPMHLEFMGSPADADDMTAKALDDFSDRPRVPAGGAATGEAFMAGLTDKQQAELYSWVKNMGPKLDVLIDKLNRTGVAEAQRFEEVQADLTRIEANTTEES